MYLHPASTTISDDGQRSTDGPASLEFEGVCERARFLKVPHCPGDEIFSSIQIVLPLSKRSFIHNCQRNSKEFCNNQRITFRDFDNRDGCGGNNHMNFEVNFRKPARMHVDRGRWFVTQAHTLETSAFVCMVCGIPDTCYRKPGQRDVPTCFPVSSNYYFADWFSVNCFIRVYLFRWKRKCVV